MAETMSLTPIQSLRPSAHLFRLLAEPVRLRILQLLHQYNGEIYQQELFEKIKQEGQISKSNFCKHLSLLLRAGIIIKVRGHNRGMRTYYSIQQAYIPLLQMTRVLPLEHQVTITLGLP